MSLSIKLACVVGTMIEVLAASGRAAPSQHSTPVVDAAGNYRWMYVNSAGEQQEFVFVPAIRIEPIIRTDIADSDGARRYTYTIGNGVSASHRLHGCVVEVALPTTVGQTPTGWERHPTTDPNEAVPRIGWFMNTSIDGEPDLPSGREVAGFQLLSPALPGVAEFLCVGNIERTFPPDLPNDIRLQAAALAGPDSVRVPALAPAIARPTDPLAIVLRRIVRSYRQPLQRSDAADRVEIVHALDEALSIDASDTRALHRILSRAVDLTARPQSGAWAAELLRGLQVSLTYILRRVPVPLPDEERVFYEDSLVRHSVGSQTGR
jgi:hypothetical protein